MTCGHIMLIVGISHPTMFHVRWWNSFQLHCARDQKLTEHFNKMLMKTNDAVSVKGLNIELQHGLWFCCFALFTIAVANATVISITNFIVFAILIAITIFIALAIFVVFTTFVATSCRWRLFSTSSSTSKQQGP